MERRLIDGVPYATLSRESGVKEGTLRSWVSRLKKFLDISRSFDEHEFDDRDHEFDGRSLL
ncbi:MAG: hypothetical protein ACK526_16645 [Planctomyces sp.]